MTGKNHPSFKNHSFSSWNNYQKIPSLTAHPMKFITLLANLDFFHAEMLSVLTKPLKFKGDLISFIKLSSRRCNMEKHSGWKFLKKQKKLRQIFPYFFLVSKNRQNNTTSNFKASFHQKIEEWERPFQSFGQLAWHCATHKKWSNFKSFWITDFCHTPNLSEKYFKLCQAWSVQAFAYGCGHSIFD